eukprot:scaffold57409_cov63-Phaeocystis_antarctica.AAC.2
MWHTREPQASLTRAPEEEHNGPTRRRVVRSFCELTNLQRELARVIPRAAVADVEQRLCEQRGELGGLLHLHGPLGGRPVLQPVHRVRVAREERELEVVLQRLLRLAHVGAQIL